jgi:hypothetical protein
MRGPTDREEARGCLSFRSFAEVGYRVVDDGDPGPFDGTIERPESAPPKRQ